MPQKRKVPVEPRTRLDVDERRTQLVALGLEHFGSRAYDDVSIDAIATAAGISKGLLYHYFPTKRAYYAAIIREAAAQLVACTETDASIAPLERLHAGLDAYLGYVREHAKAYATLLRSGVGVDREIARIVDETRADIPRARHLRLRCRLPGAHLTDDPARAARVGGVCRGGEPGVDGGDHGRRSRTLSGPGARDAGARAARDRALRIRPGMSERSCAIQRDLLRFQESGADEGGPARRAGKLRPILG